MSPADLEYLDREIRLYRKYGELTASALMELTEKLEADNERLRALVEELERELAAADDDGQYYPGIHKP